MLSDSTAIATIAREAGPRPRTPGTAVTADAAGTAVASGNTLEALCGSGRTIKAGAAGSGDGSRAACSGIATETAVAASRTVEREAAAWVVREERGLTPAEQDALSHWLAADPRHAAAMNRSAAAWSLLDRLPESAAAPVLSTVTRRRSFWRRTVALGSLDRKSVV